MATGGHFGWPKIIFDRISGHFRSIRSFLLFLKLFTKWPPAAILDDRKLLSIATFFLICFSKWPPAAILHSDFWPKSIGTSLYSICQSLHQIWSWSVHFWLSYRVHKLFRHIFIKWPPAAILVFPICSKIDRVLPL